MNKPSSASFIERRKVSIAAGKVSNVNIFGRVFACTEANGPFEMRFNDGDWFAARKGVEWAMVGEDRFNKLSFRAAVATEVEFYGGNFFWHENVVVPVIQVAKTKLIPGGLTSLAAGTSKILDTVPAGCSYRKSVVVTNDDPAVDLQVDVDDPANPGTFVPAATVFFKQAWYLETSDKLRIRNASAGVVNCKIVETFYLA